MAARGSHRFRSYNPHKQFLVPVQAFVHRYAVNLQFRRKTASFSKRHKKREATASPSGLFVVLCFWCFRFATASAATLGCFRFTWFRIYCLFNLCTALCTERCFNWIYLAAVLALCFLCQSELLLVNLCQLCL